MIVTLTGPSAGGKSTALRYFMSTQRERWSPEVVPKYVTRQRRSDDGNEVVHVESIPSYCDLVYEQYGTRYGFESKSVRENLEAGSDCLIIVNDVRVVADLRSIFGPNVLSVFVFKENPSLERFQQIADSRGVPATSDVLRRFQKAQAIFRIYIENIIMFDRTVLNVGNRTLLRRQVESVVSTVVAQKAESIARMSTR